MNLSRNLNDDIVHWPRQAKPDQFGNPLWGAAVSFKARWDDDTVEFIGKDGTRNVSRAVIISNEAASAVKVGDYIKLGTLPVGSSPQAVPGAWEVQSVKRNRSLKGGYTVYTIMV